MIEFVQITAQYSNAVLVAILPHVSDFAQKLELPISTPIIPAQVRYFKCDPRKDFVGGMVELTNRFQFTFLNGRVCVYRSPESYFSLQSLDVPSTFYGNVKYPENEALQIADKAILSLGYSRKVLQAESAPVISRTEPIGTNTIPRLRLQWIDPLWKGRAGLNKPAVLDVEVNTQNRQIEMMVISSRETQKPNPKIGIEPTLVNQPTNSNLVTTQNKFASKAYSAALLPKLIPMLNEFATNAHLSISNLTTNDVDLTRYICVLDEGSPVAQLYLRNGDRFNFAHGHVAAFYAHDALHRFPEIGDVTKYVGKPKISTNEAISLSKEILHRLGYSEKVKSSFSPPFAVPSENFTRYFVNYSRSDNSQQVAAFEIDLETKAVKSVYLDDTPLWRDPPKIDVPIAIEDKQSEPSKGK